LDKVDRSPRLRRWIRVHRETDATHREIRAGVRNPSLRTGVLASVLACLVAAVAIWMLSANPSGRATAQELPTPTVDLTALPEDVRTWMAAVRRERASLPASVANFKDLVTLLSAEPAPTALAPRAHATGTMTYSVALPLVANGWLVPRALGTVTLVSGPTLCGDEQCYDIKVQCEQLADPVAATLRVGRMQDPVRGTIVLASGWTGTYWWEDSGSNYKSIVDRLQAAGFRTAQIRWQTNWWGGASNQLEGDAKLACRPATVLRWVYDNLHPDAGTPFCAEGHSDGASQVGYPITQYGLADLFSLVLFESGPNFVRIDYGCIEDTSDPGHQALYYNTPTGRGLINWSLGLPQNTGACVDQDVAFLPYFEEASLAYAMWQYSYPHTMAAFVFGEDDLGTTAAHGLYYYNKVADAGSPLVSMAVVANTGHFVADTQQGMNTILETLFDECITR
jgi:hypothetical protein